MKASDIMNTRIVSVAPEASVAEIAGLMLTHGVSGVPVVEEGGRLVGMVTEGDLICRPELDTEHKPRSWWLQAFGNPADLAAEYARSRGNCASDIMSRNLITVRPDATLRDIAELLEKRHIKRVPVVSDGAIVGIVSRANLVQALASAPVSPVAAPAGGDTEIREEILATLEEAPWAGDGTTSVTVRDGKVEFWGLVGSEDERRATRVAVEQIGGVAVVEDHRKIGVVAPNTGL